MNLDLAGAAVLVVGATGGIGHTVVETLVAEGCVVYAAARTPAEPSENRVVPVRMDLADPASIESAVGEIAAQAGTLRGVVVTAATPFFGDLESIDRDAWANQFEVKYLGPAELARRVIPHLELGSGIVLLSGIAASVPFPSNPAGGAANAALDHLVKFVALHGAPRVRAVGVSPGFTRTARLEQFSDRLADIESKIPLRRLAEPSEIADLVAFLLSPRAAYITGTTIVADGGRTLRGADW